MSRLTTIHDIDDCKAQQLEDEIYKLKNELGCECFMRFPITILISEATQIDQKSLDVINGRYYTKLEYVKMMRAKGEVLVEYDDTKPPERPVSQRKEWIKVVKLPFPSKTDGTEINEEIMKRFTDAVLSCRQTKRILCYVPSLFPTDFARYRTLAIIVLGYLQDIDVDMVETTCPDCNKEYNGSEVKMLCTKCRMESN
jgi:hypothetical protein